MSAAFALARPSGFGVLAFGACWPCTSRPSPSHRLELHGELAGSLSQRREIMSPPPTYLELHIDGVAGVPRTFRWESRTFK